MGAVVMHVRCIDAAREAARLAARGDTAEATLVAQAIAPPGAAIVIHYRGGYITAKVSTHSPVLPGVRIAAEAVAFGEHSSPPQR